MSSIAPSSTCAPRESSEGSWWYVIRYRMLTAWLKQQMETCTLDIFHKYKLAKVRRGATVEVHQVPVLSGYIFVHAPFTEVRDWAQELNLHVMRDPFWEYKGPHDSNLEEGTEKTLMPPEDQQYIRISHQSMEPFMNAVNLRACDLEFVDPSEYDPEKDDLVSFIDGGMEGTMGYLKPGKGRNGGTVIIPLISKALCYRLDARQDEVTVIAFAKGNRHAKDCVFDMRPIVDEAFRIFKKTRNVNEETKKKLVAFVRRYGQAKLNTSTQKAQHYALLYRIHTILDNREKCKELRKMMREEIIPDLMRRRDAALKRNNTEAATKHAELLNDIKATKAALWNGRNRQRGKRSPQKKVQHAP